MNKKIQSRNDVNLETFIRMLIELLSFIQKYFYTSRFLSEFILDVNYDIVEGKTS